MFTGEQRNSFWPEVPACDLQKRSEKYEVYHRSLILAAFISAWCTLYHLSSSQQDGVHGGKLRPPGGGAGVFVPPWQNAKRRLVPWPIPSQVLLHWWWQEYPPNLGVEHQHQQGLELREHILAPLFLLFFISSLNIALFLFFLWVLQILDSSVSFSLLQPVLERESIMKG